MNRTFPLLLVAATGATGPMAHANDASIALEAGAPRAIDEPEVRMVSEHLVFRHQPPATLDLDAAACEARSGYAYDGGCALGERWDADLTYVFENLGEARTLQIGLPFRLPPADSEHAGPAAGEPLGELHTFVDGVEVPVATLQDVLSGDGWSAERTYLVEVSFAAGQTRALRHRFEAWGGGNASGGRWFTYLLETGRGWASSIGEVRVEFELGQHAPCLAVSLPHEHRGNTVLIELRDWEPDRNLELHWLPAQAAMSALGLYDDTPGSAAAVCSAVPPGEVRRTARALHRLHGAPPAEGDDVLLGQPPQVCLFNDVFAGTLFADLGSDVPQWQRDAVASMRLPERAEWETLLSASARECLAALPPEATPAPAED